ncbi:MAG: hypothetical protein ABR955_14685 [Verrucomicrobiota bacterium]|jgi:hypothetical protein
MDGKTRLAFYRVPCRFEEIVLDAKLSKREPQCRYALRDRKPLIAKGNEPVTYKRL